MNVRRFLSLCVPLVALAAILADARTLPGPERNISSSTRSFRLDGRRFIVDGDLTGDAALLSRLMKTAGIAAPPDLPDVGTASGTDLPVSVLLRDGPGERKGGFIPLPGCFRSLHTLELEDGMGSVGIVLGTIPRGRGAVRESFAKSGWILTETAGEGEGRNVLGHFAKGRESFVAFLDETEGKFLLFRRLER